MGLGRLLEIVGLEMTTNSIRADSLHIRRVGGREFQTPRAAKLKLRAPNEV